MVLDSHVNPRHLALAFSALALVLAAPASARVIQAETILPPGQSGFVGPDGQSPHSQDQLSLFEKLIFKPEPLGGGPGGSSPSEPRPGVTIRRDDFGVPAINATNESDLWWGVGYAVAQDRLGEMELFRRRGAGTLAEVLGKDSLRDDLIARRDYYTDAELLAMFQKLPAPLRARTQAYVDGVNAWIAHVRQTPADMPSEFTTLNVPLNDWTLLDSLRIGVLLARTIPSGDGNELQNLAALRKLGARRFDQYLPLRIAGEIPSIPARAGSFPSRPGRTRAQEKAAYTRSQLWLKKIPLPKAAPATAARVPTGFEREAHGIDVGLGGVGGSFMWAIRRPSDSHTFFFNGPQLGYQSPNTFVELDLQAPGIRLHTATAPGVPVNSNGYNEHVAWGVTSGLSDDDDLFVEKLVGKERYRYKGKVLKMSCRTERFNYTDAGTMKFVDRRLCRTIHGPVQGRVRGYAFARRYAIWGRELDTLTALAGIGAATSVKDVDKALLKTSWTENIMAADDQGHIGYWHPGLYPLRNVRWDERLPLPGDGSADWDGRRGGGAAPPRRRQRRLERAPAALEGPARDRPAWAELARQLEQRAREGLGLRRSYGARRAPRRLPPRGAAAEPRFRGGEGSRVFRCRDDRGAAQPLVDRDAACRCAEGARAGSKGRDWSRSCRPEHIARLGRQLHANGRRRHTRAGRRHVAAVQGGRGACDVREPFAGVGHVVREARE